MDATRLAAEVERPALHHALLGRFKGPYSLGVGRDETSSAPVLLLMVAEDVKQPFPAEVTIGGESVPVVVRRDFKAPVPLDVGQQRS